MIERTGLLMFVNPIFMRLSSDSKIIYIKVKDEYCVHDNHRFTRPLS
jgi:hypothetical protein